MQDPTGSLQWSTMLVLQENKERQMHNEQQF